MRKGNFLKLQIKLIKDTDISFIHSFIHTINTSIHMHIVFDKQYSLEMVVQLGDQAYIEKSCVNNMHDSLHLYGFVDSIPRKV